MLCKQWLVFIKANISSAVLYEICPSNSSLGSKSSHVVPVQVLYPFRSIYIEILRRITVI